MNKASVKRHVSLSGNSFNDSSWIAHSITEQKNEHEDVQTRPKQTRLVDVRGPC